MSDNNGLDLWRERLASDLESAVRYYENSRRELFLSCSDWCLIDECTHIIGVLGRAKQVLKIDRVEKDLDGGDGNESGN